MSRIDGHAKTFDIDTESGSNIPITLEIASRLLPYELGRNRMACDWHEAYHAAIRHAEKLIAAYNVTIPIEEEK